jgi:hypothetical protein
MRWGIFAAGLLFGIVQGLTVGAQTPGTSGATAQERTKFTLAARESKTQVVILGTGTPQANPDASGPAVTIVVNGTAYLVDCGPGVVRRAAAAQRHGIAALQMQNLKTVFIAHLHSDHTLGYPDLIFSPWVLRRAEPLEAYGPRGLQSMTEHIEKAWEKDIDVRTISTLDRAGCAQHSALRLARISSHARHAPARFRSYSESRSAAAPTLRRAHDARNLRASRRGRSAAGRRASRISFGRYWTPERSDELMFSGAWPRADMGSIPIARSIQPLDSLEPSVVTRLVRLRPLRPKPIGSCDRLDGL